MPRGRKPSNVVVKPYSYSPQFQPYNADGLAPRSARSNPDDELESPHTDHLQSQPLLVSSSSQRFSASTSTKKSARSTAPSPLSNIIRLVRRLPLALGLFVALLLFVLAAVSYQKPEWILSAVLEEEDSANDSSPSDHLKVNPPLGPHDIDYSNYSSFPLSPLEYAAECWKVFKSHKEHLPYWVAPEHGVWDVPHPTPTPSSQCFSTITYQLDPYVGLGAHLAIIIQAAALARERNRTFLIDDQFWNRGKWTDHFLDVRITQPGPQINCVPPPPEELVSCPRLARHWIINSRTAKFHFGPEFQDHYQDAYKHDLDRLKPIFLHGEASLLNTIIPNEENTQLIQSARTYVGEQIYLGVHIRRGDRKSMSWRFHGEPVPLENFVQNGVEQWARLRELNSYLSESPVIWVASDSSSAIRDLTNLLPPESTVMSLHSSEEVSHLQSIEEYNQVTWNQLSLDRRILETRGMIVDFALLTGAWMPDGRRNPPQAIICTLPSNVCKLSAMVFGWEDAFSQKLWVEIDNAGNIEPVWEAFELF